MAETERSWEVLDRDRELFDRELASFVPPRVFDAHVHLFKANQPGGPDATLEAFRRAMDGLLPGREIHGLCFPFPYPNVDAEAANCFLAAELEADPRSFGQMLVTPEMDVEHIRGTVRRNGFAGLKCYHVYSREQPTFHAAIPSYLPEEQVRLAHEEGLSITLHMVRARALADPVNQEVIRAWAERYPNARLILAHAARGFNPHHTVQGIESLRGLRNVWCDTSAVTESGAFEAILRTLGVERLLYGADFPVSHIRGRCVAIGDSFLWLSPANTNFSAPYGDVEPSLVGLESLRVLKLACSHLRLSDPEVEKIFSGNAAELFGEERKR